MLVWFVVKLFVPIEIGPDIPLIGRYFVIILVRFGKVLCFVKCLGICFGLENFIFLRIQTGLSRSGVMVGVFILSPENII